MANHLKNALSPYLRQHQDNPVEWYPWGIDALQRAQQLERPIFLSIGYASCHWCHVMAHESFENEEIAAFLNQYFVCIKVDREERPDLDAVYMQAMMYLQEGEGGWPLNVFLTSEGKPFYGGTYFPLEPNYGQPSFWQILHYVRYLWLLSRDSVTELSSAIVQLIDSVRSEHLSSMNVSYLSVLECTRKFYSALDYQKGGFKGAPKFPQVPFWRHLLIAECLTGEKQLCLAQTLTMTKLCQGGVYDHLAGGFMRYATDEDWLVPHFEKMLYDNAQIILWLTEFYRSNKDLSLASLIRQRITETVYWLESELLLPESVFAASLDADTEGEEGRYYLWRTEEIESVLGEAATLFKQAYGIKTHGQWARMNIPHRNHHYPLLASQEKVLKAARKKLLLARQQRIPPLRDEKILADWNGLVVSALAWAGRALLQPVWVARAEQTFEQLIKILYPNYPDGVLYHCFGNNLYSSSAFLEDYANLIEASLTLYQTTGRKNYLEYARNFVRDVENYCGTHRGGFGQNSRLAPPLISQVKPVLDNSVPSGNGTMALNYVKLWYLTGEWVYEEKAKKLFELFAYELTNTNAPFYSTLATALALLEYGIHIKILAAHHDEPLAQTVFQRASPLSVIQWCQAEGPARVIFCRQRVCHPAITDEQQLLIELEKEFVI